MSSPESNPPQNPAGEFIAPDGYNADLVHNARDALAIAPALLRQTVEGLTDSQLSTKYRNWTIRQITNHVADSHLHSLIRCKWALTEETPTIKAYNESRWAELADAKDGPVGPSLDLLDAIHVRYVNLINSLTPEQCQVAYHHPESDEVVPLWNTFAQYAWHARHHTAQIAWIRKQKGW